MKKIIVGALLALGCAGAIQSASASQYGVNGFQSLPNPITEVQYDGDRYCRRLRRACENKYERGEEGEGNCRRYRRECGGRSRY